MKTMQWMFAIAILAVSTLASSDAFAAGPPRIPVTQRKFDHARHAEAATKAPQANRRQAACADCHQYDDKGVRKKGKEHAIRCVKCHRDPSTCEPSMKSTAATSPGRRCVVCHVMDKCKPPNLPPAPSSDSFQASFSHGDHIGFGAAIERECATCHTEQAPAGSSSGAAGVGHSLCSDCHKRGGRSKLEMTRCEGCHQPPRGKAGPSGNPFQLSNFNHRKHHAEATRNQAACTQCHTPKKMMGAGKAAVPRPDMLTCQNECHNGTRAFSAVGTKCTSCHQSVGGQATPNKTELPFSHEAHAKRNVAIKNCEACHTSAENGNLEPPLHGKEHMPCAASGCHQTEFASKQTKICGVCHDVSMPWQKAIARMRPEPIKQEYWSSINHESHLAKKGQTNSACGDCHGDKLGGAKKAGQNVHGVCAECHGREPRAFAMSSCAGCHLSTPPKKAGASEWSVAATFVHEKHAQNPKTKSPTQCVGCHADVKKARDLETIKRPTMQSCDACHDGKSAFKTTGYECSRCHTRPKQDSTPTAMLDDHRARASLARAPLVVVPE